MVTRRGDFRAPGHGPDWVLTVWVNGRPLTQAIPREAVAATRAQIDEYVRRALPLRRAPAQDLHEIRTTGVKPSGQRPPPGSARLGLVATLGTTPIDGRGYE